MSVIKSINRLFGNKPKAFLVDDEEGRCGKEDMKIVESLNVDVDRFTDFNTLLYNLRKGSFQKYKFGIIHQNGTKYPSQILSHFIKTIDPSIKLIIYKDGSQLKEKTETMVLTS
jgi:hypothetical protein